MCMLKYNEIIQLSLLLTLFIQRSSYIYPVTISRSRKTEDDYSLTSH